MKPLSIRITIFRRYCACPTLFTIRVDLKPCYCCGNAPASLRASLRQLAARALLGLKRLSVGSIRAQRPGFFQRRGKTCKVQQSLFMISTASPLYREEAGHRGSQGAGFYLGLAFWPGGTLDDWGPAIDSETISPGLSPCLLTPYSSTNATDATNITTSHQEYLVNTIAQYLARWTVRESTWLFV